MKEKHEPRTSRGDYQLGHALPPTLRAKPRLKGEGGRSIACDA